MSTNLAHLFVTLEADLSGEGNVLDGQVEFTRPNIGTGVKSSCVVLGGKDVIDGIELCVVGDDGVEAGGVIDGNGDVPLLDAFVEVSSHLKCLLVAATGLPDVVLGHVQILTTLLIGLELIDWSGLISIGVEW